MFSDKDMELLKVLNELEIIFDDAEFDIQQYLDRDKKRTVEIYKFIQDYGEDAINVNPSIKKRLLAISSMSLRLRKKLDMARARRQG